jgi:N-acetylglucosamine-6-sulfatase
MSVDRKLIVGTLFLLLFSTATATAAPNIVVILTDDQDNTGSMAHMPKVLSLIAEHGITFSNSFVNFSLCAPSRSSLLTGEAAHNDGVRSNKAARGGGWASFKNDEDDTLPVWLKSAGYTTALLGKYVNGYGKGKPPRQSGIGYWAGAIGKWIDLSGNDASTQDP